MQRQLRHMRYRTVTIGNERILEIQQKINSRPRKRFGHENPIFAMNAMNELYVNLEVALVALIQLIFIYIFPSNALFCENL